MEKKEDFRKYYSDSDTDFSFREVLIRSIYLEELKKNNIESPGEMQHIARKSIIAGDILLENLWNMENVK